MSSSTPTDDCTPLDEYVRLLVAELSRADYAAFERLRAAVGNLRARISLDDDSIEVWFAGDDLVVESADGRAVDGEGATTTTTVHDLLDGHVDVMDAILDGRVDVRGHDEDVNRIFVAIEILLDASARSPALQKLADRFRADPCHARAAPVAVTRRTPWFPPRAAEAEERLLERLGLLPRPLDARDDGWQDRRDVDPRRAP